jgi:hypothetical protein
MSAVTYEIDRKGGSMSEENPVPPAGPARSKDEVALELMKFIAMTTGYGKGPGSAGYGAKSGRSAEEYADTLLELFERCRTVVNR